MARKQLKEPNVSNEELKQLVTKYIADKTLADTYKDLASDCNTQIKAMMETLGISECEDLDGDNIATVTEQTKETFNEDALIVYLKDYNCDAGIVKTKEYVDMDALEAAIYHDRIPKEVLEGMAEYKETKITKVLRIKKVKR